MDAFLQYLITFITWLISDVDASFDLTADVVEAYNSYGNHSFIFRNLIEYLIPVALALVALRWASNLLLEILSKDFSLELILYSFLRLMIGVILVSNTTAIFTGLSNFSNALIGSIRGVVGSTSTVNLSTLQDNLQAMLDNSLIDSATVEGSNLVDSGLYLAVFTVRAFSSAIVRIIIRITAFSRNIALFIATIYTPIAFSNCYEGGMNCGAVRFARYLLHLLMEPAVAIVFCGVWANLDTSLVISNFMPGGGTGAEDIVLVFSVCAIIAALFKARSVSRAIFC